MKTPLLHRPSCLLKASRSVPQFGATSGFPINVSRRSSRGVGRSAGSIFMSRFWAVSYLLLCISLTRCSNHGGNASVLREVSRGTAIFFIWLDDRFVVATDSMAAVNNGKSPPDYNDSKIDLQGK